MLNMNRVTLLGHAGRDPEVRTIKNLLIPESHPAMRRR